MTLRSALYTVLSGILYVDELHLSKGSEKVLGRSIRVRHQIRNKYGYNVHYALIEYLDHDTKTCVEKRIRITPRPKTINFEELPGLNPDETDWGLCTYTGSMVDLKKARDNLNHVITVFEEEDTDE